MSSESYVPIVGDDARTSTGGVNSQPRKERGVCTPLSIVVSAVLIALAVGVTYAVTKKHFNKDDSATYDRSKAYVIPDRYTATMDFKIPYIDLVEPLEVTVDRSRSSMRVSYWDGADTYIYTPNASYALLPVFKSLGCLSSPGAAPVDVFPNMTYFKPPKEGAATVKMTTRAYPKGVECDVWEFKYGTPTGDDGANATATLPNAQGYVGDYFFYVSHEDGAPVSFAARNGHNVVLGGSHYDHYQLDYVTMKELDAVDERVFNTPYGLECSDSITPSGPTRLAVGDSYVRRSHPLHDLEMIFPRGHARRAGQFASYARRHGKTYASAGEEHERAWIYHANQRFINAHNRRERMFTLTDNHLADRTEAERAALNGYRRPAAGSAEEAAAAAVCDVYKVTGKKTPDEKDWRGKSQGGPLPDPGYVNAATDQGTCGSCWTFGAASAAEAAHMKKHGELIKLSQQSIVDCVYYEGTAGCLGGEGFLAYEWLLDHNNGSWALLESYPYMNQNGYCHAAIDDGKTTNPATGEPIKWGTQLVGCTHVTDQYLNGTSRIVNTTVAVDSLHDALAFQGPLSVAIDATVPEFYFYDAGYFYSDKCKSLPSQLDHAVTAVGYTTGPDGVRYTIIRNSWSNNWGDNGYVLMSSLDNNCGVATMPSFVEVA